MQEFYLTIDELVRYWYHRAVNIHVLKRDMQLLMSARRDWYGDGTGVMSRAGWRCTFHASASKARNGSRLCVIGGDKMRFLPAGTHFQRPTKFSHPGRRTQHQHRTLLSPFVYLTNQAHQKALEALLSETKTGSR